MKRREYEEGWKREFSARLKRLIEGRGMELSWVAEAVECTEARLHALLEGKDYPTVVELLRLCYLCYDADDVLFGARDGGFRYLLRGRFS